MGLSITAKGARQIAPGIWSFDMPPHQVRFFGECRKAEGERSILLLANSKFDAETHSLVFDADDAAPLNVGTTNFALAVSASAPAKIDQPSIVQASAERSFGPGDKEFLGLAEQLPPNGYNAARKLLDAIRAKYPGDLKRGLARNFSNTPDNFWYVIVQPRIGGLSITVRGAPSRFGQTKLQLKDDRPGYTRFKVTTPDDVVEACQIIFSAKKSG